jgi:pachytene checkpoint protein 2
VALATLNGQSRSAMNVADTISTNIVLPDPQGRYGAHWDAIVVDQDVKTRLLNHALLAMKLRSAGVDFTATATHGLIALIGPPGTGKTTLARGAANSLAAVVPAKQCRLIEVRPHGLMSAEHGQSQRAVEALLVEHIPSLAADELPTVVLLDEVESMAVARSAASLSANPVDVHRATDAVLTALDTITATASHIIFIVTSNFPDGLDEAFLSRADVLIRVPLPSVEALQEILADTLRHLAVPFPQLAKLADTKALRQVAARIDGADGRQARKLVAAALALKQKTVLDPNTLTIEALNHAATALATELVPKKGASVRAA